MQNKNEHKDMRQPNSFQEQSQNKSTTERSKEEKDTRQPNSFQEQSSNMEKNHTR